MKKLILAALAAVSMLAGAGNAQAAATVQVGRLSCDVEGGIGFIIGSSKDMTCYFYRSGHKTETYQGNIKKLGIDIGFTGKTHIEWLVFAATSTDVRRHALAGTYIGASAEATVGLGLGANWLVGGFDRSYALQPLSVQGQIGLNYSIAAAGLTLY